MKKKIIIGNWKMNKNIKETKCFIKEFLNKYKKKNKEIDISIAPSYTFLQIAKKITKNTLLNIIAQNMHEMDEGAYTGGVSAKMLKSIGINKVIIGHSEIRKNYLHEDKILYKKINKAIQHNMKIIFCIGENIKDRNKNNHFKKIKKQIEKTLLPLSYKKIQNIIIAYEPIWAIGKNKSADPNEIQKMHKYIREIINLKYKNEISKKIKIIYGGSLNIKNAKEIFSKKDIDGGLIGNSSLNVNDFIKIINIIENF